MNSAYRGSSGSVGMSNFSLNGGAASIAASMASLRSCIDQRAGSNLRAACTISSVTSIGMRRS